MPFFYLKQASLSIILLYPFYWQSVLVSGFFVSERYGVNFMNESEKVE